MKVLDGLTLGQSDVSSTKLGLTFRHAGARVSMSVGGVTFRLAKALHSTSVEAVPSL